MAPEQLEGKEADECADLWALGCVLYEMATGKHAFEGTSQASLIAAILKEEPRTLTEMQPLAPPALKRIVRHLLAKDPAERWQSARDVMHELKSIAEAGPQTGVAVPVAARRRRRERLAWVLMIAAVAVALAAVIVWLAYDSNETGRPEIYVRSFPEPREKHRVSISGGTAAQWSQDGRELLIWTSGQQSYIVGSIFSVDVQTNPSFKAGTPRLLFTPRQDLVGIAATSDLKRFLAAVPVEGAVPPGITVILNWQTMLKR